MSQQMQDNIWARLVGAVKGVPVGNTYALLADDGTIGGLSPFNRYYCDPANGDDANDGLSVANAVQTLAAAYALTVAGQNDTIVLVGDGATTGTARVDSSFTWAKNATHLIGICAPVLYSQRARIAPTAATTAFSPFFTISGSGCVFENIQWFHGFNTGTATEINLTVTGGRNLFRNCHIAGIGDTTAAAGTGSRSLIVSGTGENVFEDCVIGIDTVTRSVANASLELASGTPRNVFRRCIFPFMTSNAGVLGILGTGNGCIDRTTHFQACEFINAVKSTSTTMTVLASFTTASPGGMLLFDPLCLMIGITDFGDANALANSFVGMAAPSASAGGIGVAPS
jgi:hypothetical protein